MVSNALPLLLQASKHCGASISSILQTLLIVNKVALLAEMYSATSLNQAFKDRATEN